MKEILKTLKIKKFELFILLFCLPTFSWAQQFDTIRGYDFYIVSNANMQKTLDEIMAIAEKCPYIACIDKDYVVELWFRDNEFSAYISMMNTTIFAKTKYNPSAQCTGITMYKQHYILINDYSHHNNTSHFFTSQDSTIDVHLISSENFFSHMPVAQIQSQLFYRYANDTIVRETPDDEIECRKVVEFDYLVKYGDTWESIAKKCRCSTKNLRAEYPEFDNPVPGMCLFLTYLFDDKGDFLGVSRF